MKTILLTFDLEEFDIPSDFGIKVNDNLQKSVEGLKNIVSLLDKYDIKATFFTTAFFAGKNKNLMKQLSKKHEIACHGLEHSDDYKKDLHKLPSAKKKIEKTINKKIFGFRAPRFSIKNISALADFGFKYDSSIHPTFIPGRYCNIFKKRKIHFQDKILEIPLSVSPFWRFPLFWLAFKNFPLGYSKLVTKLNFFNLDFTMLVFHPWEFADLSKINLPNYVKEKNGKELIEFLEKYILFCKKNNFEFSTIENYLKSKNFTLL